jgi:putative nucleotide binding protein
MKKLRKKIKKKVKKGGIAKEEFAYVLEYLPCGQLNDKRPKYQKKPIVLGIGEKYFTLLEMIPKENVIVKPYERVYIGDGDRAIIDHVKRNIGYDDLSQFAQKELLFMLEKLVLINENRLLSIFFTEFKPYNNRYKTKSQLLGISAGMCMDIIEESNKMKFRSFDDLAKRVKGLHDPKIIIINWVLRNINNGNKDENNIRKVFEL